MLRILSSSKLSHFADWSSKAPKAEKLLRVGLYDLERTLGKGNFAIVKLGVHKLTKTKVAVKIVNKFELDDENLGKISREIDIMRHLSHKNIIQLYQVMESDSFMYIITEFAANGEIFDWLVSNKKMSENQAAKTFSQILNAVNYCHIKNVVHRDLKAENLLLDHDGNIKIADFRTRFQKIVVRFVKNDTVKSECQNTQDFRPAHTNPTTSPLISFFSSHIGFTAMGFS